MPGHTGQNFLRLLRGQRWLGCQQLQRMRQRRVHAGTGRGHALFPLTVTIGMLPRLRASHTVETL